MSHIANTRAEAEMAVSTEVRIGKFAYNRNITSITIPHSVKIIGKYAFAGCINLTLIKIPDSVSTIEAGAFHRCGSLKMVTASCFTSEERANPLNTNTFTDCHPDLRIVTYEEIAAAITIQTAFRQARYNPRHKMCRIIKIKQFWSEWNLKV